MLVVIIDESGQPVGPILKTRPVGCAETSETTYAT